MNRHINVPITILHVIRILKGIDDGGTCSKTCGNKMKDIFQKVSLLAINILFFHTVETAVEALAVVIKGR